MRVYYGRNNSFSKFNLIVITLVFLIHSNLLKASETSTTNSLLLKSSLPKSQSDSTSFKVKGSIFSEFLSDETNEKSTTTGSYINLKGQQIFSKMFKADLSFTFYVSQGYYSYIYSTDGSTANSTILSYANVSFQPHKRIKIKAGLLGNNFINTSSFYKTSGFIGLLESFNLLENDKISFSLVASQKIPSGSERTPAFESETPSLLQNGFELSLNPNNKIEINSSFAHYIFDSLPSKAAQSSQRAGNRTLGIGTSARFQYDFSGLESNLSFTWLPRKNLNFSLGAYHIINLKADEENTGYSIGLSGEYKRNYVNYSSSLDYYYLESEILPAVYAILGTNKKAINLNFTAEFPKKNFKVFANFEQSNSVIESNLFELRDLFTIGLEAKYDIL